MPWDIDTIDRHLRELVDRALHDHGEPPFPFIDRVEVAQDMAWRAMEVRLQLTSGRQTTVRIAELEFYSERDREGGRLMGRTVRNTATDFAQLEHLLIRRYIERARERHRHIRIRQATERGEISSPEQHRWCSYDADREVENWTQAAYSYRDQRRAMSHSFQGQRRPAQWGEHNPYAQQMWQNMLVYAERQTFDITGVAPAPNPHAVTGAHRKGRELLWNNITEAQKITLKERGYFEVVGNRSGHTYRIYHGTQQNVVKMPGPMPRVEDARLQPGGRFSWLNPFRLEEIARAHDRGEVMPLTPREVEIYSLPYPQGLCFIYPGLVPGDVMLGQKLSIETEEDKMLKVAITFGVGHNLDLLNYDAARNAEPYWADMICAPPATAMEA